MIVPEHYMATEYRIEGEILFPLSEKQKQIPDEEVRKQRFDLRTVQSTTHATVTAQSVDEACEKFAALYAADVRIKKVEREG